MFSAAIILDLTTTCEQVVIDVVSKSLKKVL